MESPLQAIDPVAGTDTVESKNDRTLNIVTCPVCAADSPVECCAGKWRLYRCDHCTHVFSGTNSERENAHFEGHDYRDWRAANSKRLLRRAQQRVDLVRPYLRSDQGAAFEIGCSTGEALAMLSADGWQSFGVDLSGPAITVAREEHPEITVAVGVDSSDLPGSAPRTFDLLMAFHVVEHVPDLTDLMTKFKTSCEADGVLYICVPHWGSLSRKAMGDDWPDLMTEHLHYFTRESMIRWLEAGGFTPLRVETGSSPWPWLGGLKRKLKPTRGLSSQATGSGMPGRLAMASLRISEIVLWPLLKLESAIGLGNELRIVARRSAEGSQMQPSR